MTLEEAIQGDDVERIREARLASQAALQEMKAQLASALALENPAVRQQLTREESTVYQGYDDFFHLLGLLEAYESDRSPHWLRSARENLALVQDRLNVAVAMLQDAVWSERGPYTHPALNRLLQAIGSGDFEAYREALHAAVDRVDAAGSAEIRETLLACESDAYDDFAELVAGAPPDHLPEDEWLQQAEHVGEQIARCDREALARRYQGGPTAMPAVNLAVHSAFLLAQGRLDEEVAHSYQDHAADALAELRGQLASQPQALEALAEMLALLEAPELDCEALIQATNALSATMQNSLDREAERVCVVCGQPAPAAGQRCPSCGSRAS